MNSPALGKFISQALERSRALSDPDHIHIAGVPPERLRAVSLHLYGRTMNSFHRYDVAAGTRQRIDVAHNES